MTREALTLTLALEALKKTWPPYPRNAIDPRAEAVQAKQKHEQAIAACEAALAEQPDPAQGFDAWQENPYTKVLQESIAHDYVPRVAALSAAANDVLVERKRQIEAEGWTTAHDDMHSNGSMALAAACYASNAATWAERGTQALRKNYTELSSRSFRWPWLEKFWKPTSQRRDLVKAAALLLAEIERLDRHAALKGTT